jgi:lactoylglutathione lyase
MQMPGVAPRPALADGTQMMGYVHLAFAVGTPGEVDALTAQMQAAGVAVLDGPRRTGDGYYESVVVDPDGNRIELCAD